VAHHQKSVVFVLMNSRRNLSGTVFRKTSCHFSSQRMARRSDVRALGTGLASAPVRRVWHGLQKVAARRLAKAGCSAREIMAITGP